MDVCLEPLGFVKIAKTYENVFMERRVPRRSLFAKHTFGYAKTRTIKYHDVR